MSKCRVRGVCGFSAGCLPLSYHLPVQAAEVEPFWVGILSREKRQASVQREGSSQIMDPGRSAPKLTWGPRRENPEPAAVGQEGVGELTWTWVDHENRLLKVKEEGFFLLHGREYPAVLRMCQWAVGQLAQQQWVHGRGNKQGAIYWWQSSWLPRGARMERVSPPIPPSHPSFLIPPLFHSFLFSWNHYPHHHHHHHLNISQVY